ncbi:MAG: tRNA preQ1(34) S-adenosylmethionine ribosyltransferase-isomerase QueA [Chloracidobacterium sp.]|nr:tRNA preQ1(34) S-adenosylmethionine ribosyltransferase-isomerase QueA [Chloracidobacterium sp.]
MRIEEFDFELPEGLIAQAALEDRAGSRMLVVDRAGGTFEDRRFREIGEYLREGDVLVVNNTRVFPARLFGHTRTGASVEVFLVRDVGGGVWETLARPGRRLAVGKKVIFDDGTAGEVVEKRDDGRVLVRFDGEVLETAERIGRTPLPPYIKRDAGEADRDRERYQTVYARERGSIAAPTAGLHFTPEVLDGVRDIGVTVAEITLHVGYGTFEPVRVEELSEHSVSPEVYEIDAATAEVLNAAQADGRRIVAVGTTATRALETNAARHGRFTEGVHEADLTIVPGHEFRAVDALLTNFHLPQSSLLVLVSTFGGHELIMRAYRHAVAAEYRFYSYGDCMLLI